MNIIQGNLSGRWFSKAVIDNVMLPLADDVLRTFPELEIADLWYDNENDFYHFQFEINAKIFDIRYYKVFSLKINGVDDWMGCSRSNIVAFLDYLKKKAKND